MSRVIYSLYIDVPEKELDLFDEKIIKKGKLPTNINTKNELKKHYDKLIDVKRDYAKSIGCDFRMFEYERVSAIILIIFITIFFIDHLSSFIRSKIK